MRRLEACYFGPDPDGRWRRLAQTLAHSAAVHCPGWAVHLVKITPTAEKVAFGTPNHLRNTQKLTYWFERIRLAQDGDEVLLIDVDTLILRPLDDVWRLDFDLAYTVKEAAPPFNAGVLFLRVSDRTRAFVAAWLTENLRLLRNPKGPKAWRQIYGGVNQAALGHLLASELEGLTIRTLPCREWNCEDSAWATFDPRVTRILHVKSGLRQAMFPPRIGGRPISPAWGAAVAAWHAAEQAALREARSA
jgi:hypothetical protein